MPPRMLYLAAALIAGAVSGPATAQTAEQNVRCLIASNVFSKAEKDQAKRQVAIESLFFFMGRLDPNMPAARLKALVLAQGKTLNPQNLGPTMNACIQQIAAKQRVMQAVGQDVARSQPKKP